MSIHTFIHPVIAARIPLNIDRPKPGQGAIPLTASIWVCHHRSSLEIGLFQWPKFGQQGIGAEVNKLASAF
jgi:hypothetical protein